MMSMGDLSGSDGVCVSKEDPLQLSLHLVPINLKRELASPPPGDLGGPWDVKPRLLSSEGGVATAHDLDEVAAPVGSLAGEQYCGGMTVPTRTLVLRRPEDETDAELDVDADSESENAMNTCEDCGKTYASAVERLQHQCSRAFMCSTCGWRGPTSESLLSHEKEVHKKYVCDVCLMGFQKRCALTSHARIHSNKKFPATYGTCPGCLGRPGNLKQHLKHCGLIKDSLKGKLKQTDVKHSIKPLKGKLKQTDVKHSIKPIRQLLCKSKPIKSRSVSKLKTFHCKLCLASFWHRAHMMRHMNKVHTLQHPFKCDTCIASLPTQRALQRHRCIHSLPRPFTCSLCSESFEQRETLMAHLQVHLKTKRQRAWAVKKEHIL